ncbi:tail fiber protein, partial [Escherichia coli]|uniref:tail fiber protein n=1 Tax=Escherichia coli TaxID=562 RepID=UPI003980B6D0
QRFAQLTGNNTFSGLNTFSTSVSVSSNSAAIMLKNKSVNESLFILAKDVENNNLWYIGKGAANDTITFHDYKGNTSIDLNLSGATFNKTVKITGQVQPSDWTNIDSRYIPAATLSNLAKLNVSNTFTNTQTIIANNEGLIVKNLTQNQGLYIRGVDTANVSRWWLGVGGASSNVVALNNSFSGTQISLEQALVSVNKSLYINGQVQPQDWTNLDARYYVQSATDAKYIWSAVRETVRAEDGGVAWNKPSGIYLETLQGGGSNRLVSHMFVNTGASTPAAQLMFGYRNGGMWYRTARDAHGFEKDWSKVYTEAQKPTPSEIGAYTKTETDQKIAQAVSDSTDLNKIYPVGIVTWFNSNVNPNTALPGLTWTYLNNGVGRTIRIAAANGSDVATTGGSDSVTLAVGNLPSHTHSFSATTSSFDYGTKNTNTTGAHTHSVSGSTSSAGHHNHAISWIGQNSTHYSGGGGGRIGTGPGYTDGGGDHAHSVSGTAGSAGNHAHSVGIGAHSHTVSGNTGGTGSGSAFSVTNQFYKLMAWVRTA